MKVWDAATGQEMLTLKGHTRPGYQRGLQPGRPADRLGQSGQDGEGLGRGDGPGNAHAQGAHGRVIERGLQPGRPADRLGQSATRR